MSVGESIHFNGNRKKGQPNVFPRTPRVNLNNLMKKVREEEKKTQRNNLAISVAAFSAVVVLGAILTL